MIFTYRCIVLAVLISVAALIINGCASLESIVPPVTEEMVRVSTAGITDIGSLNRGRDIYIRACGRCHGLVSIEKHSTQKWAEILPPMSKLSKLDPLQTADLTAYISVAKQ